MNREEQIIGGNLPGICKEFGANERDVLPTYRKIRKVFCDVKNCDTGAVFASKRICVERDPGAADTTPCCVAEDDFQNIDRLIDSYSKIRTGAKEQGMSAREIAVLDVFEYMILVEGVYSFNVNRLCYLLVSAYDLAKMYFFGKCDMDLITRDIKLSKKLNLLRACKFSRLADACNIDLRNAAAHLSFAVGEPAFMQARVGTPTNSSTNTNSQAEDDHIWIRRRRRNRFEWSNAHTNIKQSRMKLLQATRLYCAAFELCSIDSSLRQSK